MLWTCLCAPSLWKSERSKASATGTSAFTSWCFIYAVWTLIDCENLPDSVIHGLFFICMFLFFFLSLHSYRYCRLFDSVLHTDIISANNHSNSTYNWDDDGAPLDSALYNEGTIMVLFFVDYCRRSSVCSNMPTPLLSILLCMSQISTTTYDSIILYFTHIPSSHIHSHFRRQWSQVDHAHLPHDSRHGWGLWVPRGVSRRLARRTQDLAAQVSVDIHMYVMYVLLLHQVCISS